MEIKTTGEIWNDLYQHKQISKELYVDLDKRWVAVEDLLKVLPSFKTDKLWDINEQVEELISVLVRNMHNDK